MDKIVEQEGTNCGEDRNTEMKEAKETKDTIEEIKVIEEIERIEEKGKNNSHIREKTPIFSDQGENLEPKKKKKVRSPDWYKGKQEILTERFSGFFGTAFLFGILYTFCMYKNPYGILYPVMVGCAYGAVVSMLRLVSVSVKRDSWFLVVTAVLLGVAVCRTADMMLIQMIKLGEFLLLLIFVIHQFYDDRRWSIGKYLGAMVVSVGYCISTVFYPFSQGKYFFKKMDIHRYRTVICVLAGLACAIPLVMLAGGLLGQADAVFGAIVSHWIESFLNIWSMGIVVIMIVFGTLGMYCLVSGACMEGVKADERDVRTLEPIAAMTCMGVITIMYVFFCVIQIYYLFMGKGNLPEGMTYSSYARQGFFQLLFVAVMNLVMVLLNLKYFKKNRFLNFILVVICGCTYVMIVSAVTRMALYVGEYHLTYLRVLVLWFLALLAVLMAGVVVLIFRNAFPLFQYCLVMVSLFFVGFSFMRPDRVVAEYNVKHVMEWSQGDFEYMTRRLSADAVPVVMGVLGDKGVLEDKDELANKNGLIEKFYDGDEKSFFAKYYYSNIGFGYDRLHKSFRSFNFSYDEAKKAMEADLKKYGLDDYENMSEGMR